LLSKNIKIKIYRTVIYYTVLKEEHRLMVFENRVRRKIFGPRREEVIGDWRRLPENLHGDQIKNAEMGGLRGSYRGKKRCIQGSAGET
jgi:hypothetical protein